MGDLPQQQVKIRVRPSAERGHADHGWLKTFHTFSFASYYDPKFTSFGPLRVINEDRVAAGEGFPAHSHSEAEIYSYIVSGELQHKDSMGNEEVMVKGDVQMTSAGTGIRHSEYNYGGKQACHFLQIWATPNKSRLSPHYYTRHFPDSEKQDRWCQIVGPSSDEGVVEAREAKGPTPIHADLATYVSILSPGQSLDFKLRREARRGYVHYISTQYTSDAPTKGSLTLSSDASKASLKEGDGAFLECLQGQTVTVQNSAHEPAEILFWEIFA
ncbi:uncharacterized protein L969DRAFT_15639 [Mixia osmundae IAM 14324]|uniref:Pirin N-terminal domain-containing protein n=1 Tax=Mixia osmundae (strain CBS 9802 / IAM 14324 / JCM 22182 / KY 12970) TaxID=764103 RepID=G7DYQ4_MIXOS|nr:uncharacterized protein L969DRAFT_15639 [Mixia osmundae IAM 14324]KEI41614.1 hypothetical protein L969DRAFT_15639 [Mixia osmundae IAM 14324]GAA95714.1 hypothetical protein E5Q_02371 [Mixia osmundae IAM 14324]